MTPSQRTWPRTTSLPHGGAASAWRAVLRVFAIQDAILIAYYAIVLGVVLARSSVHSIEAATSARRVWVALAMIALGAYVARVHPSRAATAPLAAWPQLAGWARGTVYRVCLVGALVGSYLMLRDLLPLVRTDSVDASLYRMDLYLFGIEPAVWLQRFNRPAIVEWFSFFYFSYFWLAALYMVAIIWVRRADRATAELAIGVLLVFCVGQLGYMAVPGFGPVHHLATSFDAPLHGGFFWSCVERTVAAGGAAKDVFPSLHTAAPTFFTVYAWRRASESRRWRIPLLVTGFFAANIIISTMLLRWHFAIDVVAGLTLGISAATVAPRIARAEERMRTRLGLALPWDLSRR